ncbi:MAG TPA: proliferating cell nuclear antigen (pcna) [archaeon]|nr:proliferating cell nuclear antigen (pcna) [archaeon]
MIELKRAMLWQKVIASISSLISEGNLRFSDKGIGFKAIDPSQIVLVDFFLDKKNFEKYEVEPSLIGVDLAELNKIMQRASTEDRLSMELSESELNLNLEGDLSRHFKLPLIDLNEDEIKIPEASFEAKIEVNARNLKEALKDAALFGSSIILKVSKGKLMLEARGSQGQLKTIVKGAKASVAGKDEIVSKYSLNYLINILKEAENEKKVFLEIKSDSPIKVSYNLGESTIQFHLAHMII